MYLTRQLIAKWEARAATYDTVPEELALCIREAKIAVAKAQEATYVPKGLDDKILFGKYKGQRVVDVIQEDPDYINWCLMKIEGFRLDEEAHNFLIENESKNETGFYNR